MTVKRPACSPKQAIENCDRPFEIMSFRPRRKRGRNLLLRMINDLAKSRFLVAEFNPGSSE